jgi:hypothetical protein
MGMRALQAVSWPSTSSCAFRIQRRLQNRYHDRKLRAAPPICQAALDGRMTLKLSLLS